MNESLGQKIFVDTKASRGGNGGMREHRRASDSTEGAGMKLTVETITPEIAQNFLDNMIPRNRKLRPVIVERYVREIKSGRWHLTPQAISLNTVGKMIDGQHRCAAVVLTGTPVKMAVIRNVPNSAFDHIDLGFSRTNADIFNLQGQTWITNEHIAIAKMMNFENDFFSKPSPFEIEDFILQYYNSISFVLNNLPKRRRGITIAPVLAATALAFYHESDRDRLAQFINSIALGETSDKNDSRLISALWGRLYSTRGYTGATRIQICRLVQRVIKAWMQQETLSKLYIPDFSIYRLPD